MNRLSGVDGLESGLTMIEVLVAVLVLAIGLLGVAGLQSVSLRNTTDVYFEHQVTGYSQDLMNRIMANPAAANSGDYADGVPNSAPSPDCSAVDCTSEEMADWDLWRWGQNLTTGFGSPPSAGVSINWDNAEGEYQIAITWDATGAGSSYATPTCSAADNSSPGCLFTAYRMAR